MRLNEITDAENIAQRARPPNTVPWPPLIYVGAALLAMLVERLVPVRTVLSPGIHMGGWVVLLAGLALDVSAMIVMTRHRANILPHRAATALVTTWPFSMSRNPIYLGNTGMLMGAAFAFGNLWLLPAAVVAVLAVTKLAIVREEQHLETLFGSAWQCYASRVPRWLSFRRG